MAGASGNKVSLVFAGDATQLEKSVKDANASLDTFKKKTDQADKSSRDLADTFDEGSKKIRGGRDVVDGASTAIGAFGATMPGPIGGILALGMGFADLADGIATTVIPALEGVGAAIYAALGPIGLTIAAAALLAAGFVLLWKNSETFRHGVEAVAVGALKMADAVLGVIESIARAWGKLPKKLGGGIGDNAANEIAALRGNLQGVVSTLDSVRRGANAATSSIYAMNAAKYAASVKNESAFGPYKSGYKLNPDQQDTYDYQYDQMMSASRAAAGRAATSAAGSAGGGAAKVVNAAMDAAKAAAEKKLASWQSVVDKARDVSRQIADALSGKLDGGGDPKTNDNVFSRLLKQANDTIRLNKELAKLQKLGLNSGMLSQLAQGGLSSLPAADQLLASGKAGVSWVNGVNATITSNANAIGQREAMNQYNNPDKTVKYVIDVTGADSEMKKMMRKFFKTDGAASYGLKAA